MAPPVVTWHLYALSAAVAAICPLVPCAPSSAEFFLLQALIWAAASFFFYRARQRAWARAGMPHGPPELQPWTNPAPCWCFEANFWTQLLYLPALLRMATVTCTSWEVYVSSAVLSVGDYTDDLWFERVLFAQLFGYMVRDFAMCSDVHDPLMAAHHIVTSLLMLGLHFCSVPGVRMGAFLLCVVELGSAGYCFYTVYRWAGPYVVLMSSSNLVWFLSCTMTLCVAENNRILVWGFWILVVALVIGRTVVMMSELMEKAARTQIRSRSKE